MLFKAHITLSTVCGEMERVPCLYDTRADAVVSAFIGDATLPRYMLVQMLTDGRQDGESELSRQEAMIAESRAYKQPTPQDLAAARADDLRDMRMAEQYAAE